MRKIFTVFSAILICSGLSAQDLYNNADVTIETGLEVYVNGDINNQTGGTLQNGGTIHLTGDFSNSGTREIGRPVTVVVSGIPAQILTGEVKLVGTGIQTLSGLSDFHHLDVDNAAGVNIASGNQGVYGHLKLTTGNVATNSRLTIRSDRGQTGLVDDFTASRFGTTTGDARVERWVDGRGLINANFHHIGYAVNGNSITELSELSLYGPDGGQIIPIPACNPAFVDTSSPYGRLFEWREDATFLYNCNQSGWFVRSSGNLEQCRGYAARIGPGDKTINVENAPLNTGTKILASRTNTVGNPSQGFHLLSNPYPSPIFWVAPTGWDAQAHIWETTGKWKGTYQSMLSGDPTAIIPHMQGFFARVSNPGATADMVFTNAQRTTTDVEFRRLTTRWEHIANIEIEGNGFADKTTIYFGDDATNEWDAQMDAFKYRGNNDQPLLYTRIADFEEIISINGLPMTNNVESVVMGLEPGISGSYKLTANDLNTFDATAFVLLEDLKEDVMHDFMLNPEYNFTAGIYDDADRFIVHFVPPAEIVATDANCDGADAGISLNMGEYILNGAAIEWNYTLTNAAGQTIASANNVNGFVNFADLAEDTYTLTLERNGYTVDRILEVGSSKSVDAMFAANATTVQEGEAIFFNDNSTGADDIKWLFGDGNSELNISNPSYAYTEAGEYEVTLVANNHECTDSEVQKITVLKADEITSIDEPVLESNVRIFGSGNVVTIEFSNFTENKEFNMEVYDVLGRSMLYQDEINSGDSRQQFTMEMAADGYYLVKLENTETRIVEEVFLTKD